MSAFTLMIEKYASPHVLDVQGIEEWVSFSSWHFEKINHAIICPCTTERGGNNLLSEFARWR